ncbi:MAG: ferritin [Planctomycetaceae bacterium]|nr:ferritin [Planctomycetaceae bacterium]|tara:strand:- start:23 stop:487 length:465 start_codon:yes stop_codon:yes gene_type:complete
MNPAKMVDQLNEVLRHEWTGLAQYAQASFVVTGLWREVYSQMFWGSAQECLTHGQQIGEKIVSLGGVPTVERNSIKQSNEIEEMLNFSLDFERTAVAHYVDAIQLAEESPEDRALVILLEDILKQEQQGVDDLGKLLRDHRQMSVNIDKNSMAG